MKTKQGLIRHSAKNKLILAFAVILLLPSLAIGWISYSTAKKKVDDQMKRAATENVNLVNQTITQMIEAKIKEVSVLSEEIKVESTSSIPENDDQKIKEKLDRYLSFHPELEGAIVGTDQGGNVYSSSKNILPGDYDPRQRPWFTQAMEKKGKVVITEPFIMQGKNKAIVSIAKVTNDGHGVISLALSLELLDDIVKKVKVSDQGYVFILDNNKKILSHPKQKPGTELPRGSTTYSIYDADSGELDYLNQLDGKYKRLVFVTNPLTGWKIAGSWYKDEVNLEAAPIFNTTILVTVFALLGGTMFVFFIIRSLPSPMLERKYQILYELSPLAILLLDSKAGIRDANPAALQLFRMTASDIQERDFPSLLIPYERDSLNRQLESGTVKVGNSDYRIVNSSQEERLVWADSEFIALEGERYQYVILRDITEQKQMQRSLEESVDRYTSLERYNPDSVISLSLDGTIMSVNPATEQIFGYTAAQLTRKHFTEAIDEDSIPVALNTFQQDIIEGRLSSMELRARHQSGHSVDILVTPAPIYIADNIVGCYVIAKDITEQKRKDELLMKSEKLSVAGQLAAGVAHEIRNPLTAIKGFIQLMGSSEAYMPKYFPIVREELERIELIIKELLMLAKPQAIQMKRADLTTLIEEVVLLIEAQAILQNIEVRLTLAEQRCFIQCDANQIKQVFINFLKNAIEAMPQGGGIEVALEIGGEEEAVVRIQDRGYGISEEQLRMIGEPFYSTKEAGTGLGMLVSYKIIENHGGRTRISSKVGVGTTIVVTLPVSVGST